MNENQQKRDEFVRLMRDAVDRAVARFKTLTGNESEEDFKKSPEYAAAMEYFRTFENKEGIDYTAVKEYAKDLYERHDKSERLLDEKADSIIRYLGGGSAIVTVGALLAIKADQFQSYILAIVALMSLLPALYLGMKAMTYAIAGRFPRNSAIAPDVTTAVKIREHYGNRDPEGINVWLILHPVCEMARLRNLQKAKAVMKAHNFYLWCLRSLLLPPILIALCLLILAISQR